MLFFLAICLYVVDSSGGRSGTTIPATFDCDAIVKNLSKPILKTGLYYVIITIGTSTSEVILFAMSSTICGVTPLLKAL